MEMNFKVRKGCGWWWSGLSRDFFFEVFEM